MLRFVQVATVVALILVAVLVSLAVMQAQAGPWMTVMLVCGGTFDHGGDHITLHDSAAAARAHGDRELDSLRYDIAYVEERAGGTYALRWVKSTSERCYGGRFRDWSDDF